ncbi:MAG: rod shape-determining protein MreD [Bacteroidia bacterium]
MITDIFVILLRYVFLVGLQVTILNNIQLSGYINPYLYILFILLLPVKFSKIAVMILALALGLTIDMFTNTQGIHAGAAVFMAYMRPFILKIFSPRDGYETDATPNIKDLGLQWWLAYSSVLVLLHHFALFYLEAFRFSEFFNTLGRVLLSSVATLILILITQLLFGKSKMER